MNRTTFFRSRNQPSRRRPPRARLQVERLEDRTVPSANIDVSLTPAFDVETNIDLNPVNSQNLVAVAFGANFSVFPPFAAGAYFSRDGGRTWGASSPLSRSIQGVDFAASADPSVAFDSRGNVYAAYEAANFDPAIGFINEALVVAKSTDGGATFTQFTSAAINITNPDLILDHPKVAVDHSPTSPFHDTVYVTWISGDPSAPHDLRLSRSTDGGLTWSAPLTLDSNVGGGPVLNTQTVGPDGTVYVGWVRLDLAGNSTQLVIRSTDGGVTFGSPVAVTTLNGPPETGGQNFPSPAQPATIAAQASLDTDRSAGPFRGRLYMAYVDRPDPDARPFDEDIYVQFSDDHGATWSPRQRVNDDGIGNSQFFPSLSVDPTNGKVLISWYDTRRDPVNIEKTNVFLAVGTPGPDGVEWRPNMRVTNKQSDESVNNPQAIGFYGDYEGLVAYGGVAHPIWSDARADNFAAGLSEEVYTTTVHYGGGDDDDRANDLQSRSGSDATDAAFAFLPAGPTFTMPTSSLVEGKEFIQGMPPQAPVPRGEQSQENGEAAATGKERGNGLAGPVARATYRNKDSLSLGLLTDGFDGEALMSD